MTGSIKVRHLGLMVLTFVFCVALTGCGGGGPTKAQYDKLKDDMTLADARKEMGGDGTEMKKEDLKKAGIDAEVPAGMKVIRWGDDNKYVTATFLEDKLKSKISKGL